MNTYDDDKEYGRTPDLNNDVPGKRKNPKRRACAFCTDLAKAIDYKDAQSLKYFISERGKIVPRRMSGNCAWHQRKVTVAIKQARNIALLPFTTNG